MALVQGVAEFQVSGLTPKHNSLPRSSSNNHQIPKDNPVLIPPVLEWLTAILVVLLMERNADIRQRLSKASGLDNMLDDIGNAQCSLSKHVPYTKAQCCWTWPIIKTVSRSLIEKSRIAKVSERLDKISQITQVSNFKDVVCDLVRLTRALNLVLTLNNSV